MTARSALCASLGRDAGFTMGTSRMGLCQPDRHHAETNYAKERVESWGDRVEVQWQVELHAATLAQALYDIFCGELLP